MAPPIPKGFIEVGGKRVAVSEISNYYDDTTNGAKCVRVVTKEGVRFTEIGIAVSTIDARINDSGRDR